MNREETKAAGETMLHYANGGEVQWKKRDGSAEWGDYKFGAVPFWDWDMFTYRIKPKPKVVERWALSDEQGHHTTMLDLDSARAVADHWEMMGSTGICLTHLTGEEQPWQK